MKNTRSDESIRQKRRENGSGSKPRAVCAAATYDCGSACTAKCQCDESSATEPHRQQEWLRRYNEVQLTLGQEKVRLYELNKQMSSLIDDENALRRFESFEAVQPTFLRMRLLERAAAQNRRNRQSLEQEAKDQIEAWGIQQKVQQQASERRQQAETLCYQTNERVFQGLELRAANNTLECEIAHLRQRVEQAVEQQNSLEGSMREHTSNVEQISHRIDALRAERQGIEMHEHMLEHGEAVLLRLERLQEIELSQEELRQRQAEAGRKQDEENELLRRLFSEFRDVTADIDSANEEINRQRVSIQGQTTGKLLERAMSLKSRSQMLLSAQSLWNRISTGYNLIEEKSQALNAVRLHIAQTEATIKELEAAVTRQERLCHEKEYTFMLSKSQNVIQLRSDLREGTGCPVCGAIHHPYHSDTMLEQSKLINEFKTDYELLDTETRSKKRMLDELRLDLAESKGKQLAEDENLASVRRRQAEDVREWRIFTSLDQSFQESKRPQTMPTRHKRSWTPSTTTRDASTTSPRRYRDWSRRKPNSAHASTK